MNKKLNTNSITNELEHSSFFPARPGQAVERELLPQPAASTPMPAVTVPTVPVAAPKPTVAPRPKVAVNKPAVQPATRGYVRRTFDIYEDQLVYLTRASL